LLFILLKKFEHIVFLKKLFKLLSISFKKSFKKFLYELSSFSLVNISISIIAIFLRNNLI